jgi:metal-responsive CopG/Arc/MetJ family transcriptional regulator
MASKFGSYMGLLLPPALYEWIEHQAEAHGGNRSEVVRWLIRREMQAAQPAPQADSRQCGDPYRVVN